MFENVIVVAGDVGEEDLGLSEADKTSIVNNVNLVFHCAATLDFDTDLPTNVNINLLGTKRILQLCARLNNCLVGLALNSYNGFALLISCLGRRSRRLYIVYLYHARRLQGFMHVSSAYVNSDRTEVDEELYPPPDDPDKIIEIAKSLDPASVDVITKK